MHLLRTLLLKSNTATIAFPTTYAQACTLKKWPSVFPTSGYRFFVLQTQQKQIHSQSKQEIKTPIQDVPSESKPQSEVNPSAEINSNSTEFSSIAEADPIQDKSVGLIQRFKRTFKQHGKVLIPVHLVTSSFWFGSFYYAAMKGVNVVPFLEYIGLPDGIVNILKNSQGGNALTAYAMYKVWLFVYPPTDEGLPSRQDGRDQRTL
ncbi:hypothetical protein GDO86_011147 [Hymenochirus boettgeri]|uniref:DUF1279 domain-containing protein n=1 Tax=Hymenochirus boettgeri TaxID=247094 RepID=A0A8T2JAK7_9PIPI|nr:hypothetical protein GDO86_011147 [Hymenochirus boettgeri]